MKTLQASLQMAQRSKENKWEWLHNFRHNWKGLSFKGKTQRELSARVDLCLFCNVVDLIFKILRKNQTRKEKLKMGDRYIFLRLCSHLRASSGVFILHDWWCVYVSTANVTRNLLPGFQIMQLCRQSVMLVLKVLRKSDVCVKEICSKTN